MKVLPIILIINFITYSLTVTKCESDDVPNPSGAKDCNLRSVDDDEYCCYIKGTMRKKYVINNVEGCFSVKKIFIDNGAIEQYLNTQKSFGNKFSLDCNASYARMGLLIILFLLF